VHVRHSGHDLGLFEHIHFTKQRDREREKRAMTAVYDGRPIIAPIGVDSRSERPSGGLLSEADRSGVDRAFRAYHP
jgi:hypothetical protein